LHQWYLERTRGEGDVRVKICMSFQKSMFCVTNAAINGTMPHPLDCHDPAEQEANAAYADAWATRLGIARTDCLSA
jgi:nicotinic acid phosphoribosyltransferase